MPRRALLLLLVVGCDKQAKQPAGDVVDQGVLISTSDGTETGRETFAIRKINDHLLITATSATSEGAAVPVKQDGELETDLQYHPIRLSYHYEAKSGGFRYTLGGKPLALDRIRDDGQNPEHVDAIVPIDVFVEAPGLIALTPLCKLDKPATLTTLSTATSGYRGGKIIVRTVGPAAKLKKLTIAYLQEFEIELYCDGERMIASGLRNNKLWNVREGREADFTAARDAP